MPSKEYRNPGIGLGVEHLPQNPEDLEKLLRLAKELKQGNTAENTKAAVDRARAAGFIPGASVRMIDNPEVGQVVGYNEALDGVYPGNRYPIVVQFERGTFEYGVESLELADQK